MTRTPVKVMLWLTKEQRQQLDQMRARHNLTREEECRKIIEDVLADDAAAHKEAGEK